MDCSFQMPKISAKLKGVTSKGGAKCRWGTLNRDEVAENWDCQREALSTCLDCKFIAPSPCCSASRRVCQQQLMLVLY